MTFRKWKNDPCTRVAKAILQQEFLEVTGPNGARQAVKATKRWRTR